jgi:hypothetical protein
MIPTDSFVLCKNLRHFSGKNYDIEAGAKIFEEISNRPGANESLSVISGYNQQRRTRCEVWCEERAGAASPKRAGWVKGCVIIPTINREKARESL